MAPTQTVLQTLTIKFEADLTGWRAGVAQVIGESRALSGQITQAMGGGVGGAAATTGIGAAITAALVTPLGMAVTRIATVRREMLLLRSEMAQMAALTAGGAAARGAGVGTDLAPIAAGWWAADIFGRRAPPRDVTPRGRESSDLLEGASMRRLEGPDGGDGRGGESIGGGQRGADARGRARFLRDHAEEMQRWGRQLAQTAAGALGLGWIGRMLTGGAAEAATATGLGAATAGVRGLGAALGALATPIGVAAAAFTVLVGLWTAANWDRLVDMFEEFSATAAPQFAEALGDIQSSFANFSDAIMELMNAIFGENSGAMIAGLRNALEFFTRTINAMAELFSGFMNVLTEGVRMWTALWQGDWQGFWDHAQQLVVHALNAISETFLSFFPEQRQAWTEFWREIGTICQRTFGATVDWLREKIEDIGGFFYELWDRVVGHSYVPDLVDGIEEHFARLQGAMVDPAQAACFEVSQAFENVGKEVSKAANDNVSAAGSMWGDLADVFRDGLAGLVNGQEGAFTSALYNMLARARDIVLNSLFDSLSEGIAGIGQRASGSGGGIFGAIGRIFGGGGDGPFNPGKIFTAAMLPGFANGVRNFAGGFAVVGERGPEIVKLPGGSDVIPNHALGGSQIVYAPQYNFSGTAEEIEAIKRQAENDRAEFGVKVRAVMADAKQRGRF